MKSWGERFWAPGHLNMWEKAFVSISRYKCLGLYPTCARLKGWPSPHQSRPRIGSNTALSGTNKRKQALAWRSRWWNQCPPANIYNLRDLCVHVWECVCVSLSHLLMIFWHLSCMTSRMQPASWPANLLTCLTRDEMTNNYTPDRLLNQGTWGCCASLLEIQEEKPNMSNDRGQGVQVCCGP